MPLGAWGFKSPLRHELKGSGPLETLGIRRVARRPVGRLSSTCHQSSVSAVPIPSVGHEVARVANVQAPTGRTSEVGES